MKITGVTAGSIAEELGIQAGDALLAFNGTAVEDILDYHFFLGEEQFVMSIGNGVEIIDYVIEKDDTEDIGLSFAEEELSVQPCRNRCIFCFVDQLPDQPLRSSLYVKDDDYRHSFISGNYVTLTNVHTADLERIIRLKLSPLYISVHSTNSAVRARMLGVKRLPDIKMQMQVLHGAGIQLHTQIVYCPGINEDLSESIDALSVLSESLAIVPVGLTRCGNPALTPVDRACAQKVVDLVAEKQERFLQQKGGRFVFASDEFYLRAQRQLPPYEAYENFPQIENGVGLLAQFEYDYEYALQKLDGALAAGSEKENAMGSCSIATGRSAYAFIKAHADKLAARTGRDIRVHEIRNDFFGDSVTVAGLLVGRDLAAQLKGKELGERLYLPRTMLKEFGDVFLDDMKVEELSKELGVRVTMIAPDGACFVAALSEQDYEQE